MKRDALCIFAAAAMMLAIGAATVMSDDALDLNGKYEGNQFIFSITAKGKTGTGSMIFKNEEDGSPTNTCELTGTIAGDRMDFKFTCEKADAKTGLKAGEGYMTVYEDEEMGGLWLKGALKFGSKGGYTYSIDCAKQNPTGE